MESSVELEGIHAKVITPDDDGYYFFGYYDLQPFDSTGRYHLCHKASFENHIPNENDICELGVIDLQTGKFIKYAQTNAWNFQQGAMLRWYRDDDQILFNVWENDAYRCCILNIKNGKRTILPMAIADVSQDGKHGVCINFSRVFDFRPGYGYAGIKDPYFDEKAPAEDGVFLMDMETGNVKQILNYEIMRDAFPKEPYCHGKLLVNHINFNPSGTRLAILFRNFSEKETPWKTQLLTVDLNGNLHCMASYALHSHYNWKNDDELLIFSGLCEENRSNGLYLFRDLTHIVTKLPDPNPNKDIHCLYSPNRRYIIGDGYPVEGYRNLHLIDTYKNVDTIIGKYYSIKPTEDTVEFRCDLHARFDRTGRYISFDSVHIGKRCICIIDMSTMSGYEY